MSPLSEAPGQVGPHRSKLLLLCTTGVAFGGMQRMVLTLARELALHDWAVQTVFPRTDESAQLQSWCRAHGVEVEVRTDLPAYDGPHTLGGVRSLQRFIRQSAPDIVNVHYGYNAIPLKDLLAIRLAGRHRCVVTMHGAAPWTEADKRKQRLTRLAAKLAHVVTVNSGATRDVLLGAGVPESKIRVIPLGIPNPSRSPSKIEAREKLGIESDAFVVGTLARLVPSKGVADLIDALSQLPDSAAQLRLLVGGDGPHRETLENLARNHLGDRASFLGCLLDPADLYAASDIFALPSHEEGFGLVYVEAALHGVPSVGTAVGGVPEAVVDGETGLLVAPRDLSGMAKAIQRLRDNPMARHRLGESARGRALTEFAEAVMVDRYARVLQYPLE